MKVIILKEQKIKENIYSRIGEELDEIKMKEREEKERREKEELRGYDRDERIEDDCSTEVQRERKECKK